tara:strand:+ start:10183 stop:10473 length:291 start_codon:yes stop_codon:yes gene_type:complete
MLASFIYLTGLFFVYMETHPSILKSWTVHHTKDMLLSITFNNFLFWVCMLIALANISWWFLLAALVIGGYFAKDVDVMGLAPKLECRNERIYLTKE